MAQVPLAVSPETVELRVGGALRLQLEANVRAAGEITWYFEGAPLPGQTGPVCRCAAGHRISLRLRAHARGQASRRLCDALLASVPRARDAATGRPLVCMHRKRRWWLTFLAASIAAVSGLNQGAYRAVVQRGPFGGLEGNIPASVEISEVRASCGVCAVTLNERAWRCIAHVCRCCSLAR